MAAEAVHLSALDDLGVSTRVPGRVRALLGRHWDAARVGALLVDLPYFGGFTRELVRYLLHLPPTPAPWGDRFHRRAPVALAAALLGEAAARASEPLTAIALGYLTHIAVDSTLHPPVNQLVSRRLVPLGRLLEDDAAQHREVEKYQSVLFHEARLGFDLMGTPRLARHLEIPLLRLFAAPAVARGVEVAMRTVLGDAPRAREIRGWCRGYRGYVFTLASPFGRTLVPERLKDWARATFYRTPELDYEREYLRALDRAIALLEAAEPLVASHALPRGVIEAFLATVPERSLDYPERQPFVPE